MDEEFTQGTLIRNIRSQKYPGIRCIGLVITARCDLANNKVERFYCVTSMVLEDWIYKVLFESIVKEQKDNVLLTLKSYCDKYKLDFDILREKSTDKILTVMQAYLSRKELNKFNQKMDEWGKLNEIGAGNLEIKEKKQFLLENRTTLENKLVELNNKKNTKYVMVPSKAYSEDGANVSGIVVDLQDIVTFDISVKDKIINCEYDYRKVKNEEERNRINQQFFFESDDDAVLAVEALTSPWTEYLMQQFAHSFSRIGVENATRDEIKKYCDSILGENN